MNPPHSFSHLNEKGEVHMVDVTDKVVTGRQATAESWVRMSQETFEALQAERAPKGDVLATVRLAAIMAVKKTSELIPLCHPLSVEKVACQIELHSPDRVRIEVTATICGKTGVEMEALTGASVGALTLYDMLKALDKGMTIGPTRLMRKTGGRSGDFQREAES
ncbi:MAG: cyclic pyranopterin monophosphate synthase MoaC [Vulcanimicrobiota bacterium]